MLFFGKNFNQAINLSQSSNAEEAEDLDDDENEFVEPPPPPPPPPFEIGDLDGIELKSHFRKSVVLQLLEHVL